MPKPKKSYIKAKIKKKKLKITYFLSNESWLDSFKLFGAVYAQSGPGGPTDGGYEGPGTDSGYGGGDGSYGGTGGEM